MSIDWLRWAPAGGTRLDTFATRQQVLQAAGVDTNDSFARIVQSYDAGLLARLARFVSIVETMPPFLYADMLSRLHAFALDPVSYCASDLLAHDSESLTQAERLRLLDAGAESVLARTKAGPRPSKHYAISLLSASERANEKLRAWSLRLLEAGVELGIVRKVEYRRALAMTLALSAVGMALSKKKADSEEDDEEEEEDLEDEEEEEEEEDEEDEDDSSGETPTEVTFGSVSVQVPAGLVLSNPAHMSELAELLADRILERYANVEQLESQVLQDEPGDAVFGVLDLLSKAKADKKQPARSDYYYWNLRYSMRSELRRPVVRDAVCALIEAFFARSPYLVLGWRELAPELRSQLSEFVAAAKSASAMLDMLEESKLEEYRGSDAEFSERYRRQVRKWTDSRRWQRARRITRLFPHVSWSLFPELFGPRDPSRMPRSLHALIVRGQFKAMMRAGYDRQSLWNADIDVKDVAYEQDERRRLQLERPAAAKKKKSLGDEQRLARQAPSIDAALRVLTDRIREFIALPIESAATTPVKGVWLCRLMVDALLRWFDSTVTESSKPIVTFMREKASDAWDADETYRRMGQLVDREKPDADRLRLFNELYDYIGLLLDLSYLGSEDILQNYFDGQIFRLESEFTANTAKEREAAAIARREKRDWRLIDGSGRRKDAPDPTTMGFSLLQKDGAFLGAQFADECTEFVRIYQEQNKADPTAEADASELLKDIDRELLRAPAVRKIAREGREDLTPAARNRALRVIDAIYRRRLEPERVARTLIDGAQLVSFSVQYEVYRKSAKGGGGGGDIVKIQKAISEGLALDWRSIANVPADDEESGEDVIAGPVPSSDEDDYNEEEDLDFQEGADEEEEEEDEDDQSSESVSVSADDEESSVSSATSMKRTAGRANGGGKGPKPKSMNRRAVIQRTGPELFNYSITERTPPWFVGGESKTFTEQVQELWIAAGFLPETPGTRWKSELELRYSDRRRSPQKLYAAGSMTLAEKNTSHDVFDNDTFAPNVIRVAGTVIRTSREQVREALYVLAESDRAWYADYRRAPPLFLRHLFVLPVVSADY